MATGEKLGTAPVVSPIKELRKCLALSLLGNARLRSQSFISGEEIEADPPLHSDRLCRE